MELGWNGFVCVKDGVHHKGIFQFTVTIPSSYPTKPPEVTFLTKISHPLIDQITGRLDLEVILVIKNSLNSTSGSLGRILSSTCCST